MISDLHFIHIVILLITVLGLQSKKLEYNRYGFRQAINKLKCLLACIYIAMEIYHLLFSRDA